MKGLLPKIAVFAVTFGLGVGVTGCWRLYQWWLQQEPLEVYSVKSEPVAATPAEPELTITGTVIACGNGSYHTNFLSDGTQITESCRSWPSRTEAERVLQKQLKDTSSQVIRFTLTEKSLCRIDAPSVKHLELYESGAIPISYKIGN